MGRIFPNVTHCELGPTPAGAWTNARSALEDTILLGNTQEEAQIKMNLNSVFLI